MDPATAYAHCEHVTRTQAGNFYWGIRQPDVVMQLSCSGFGSLVRLGVSPPQVGAVGMAQLDVSPGRGLQMRPLLEGPDVYGVLVGLQDPVFEQRERVAEVAQQRVELGRGSGCSVQQLAVLSVLFAAFLALRGLHVLDRHLSWSPWRL